MRPRLALLSAFAIVACASADARPVRPAAVSQSRAVAAPDERVTRADLARIDGRPNARLWILVVSDFQCPYCKEYHDKTSKLVHQEFVESGIARMAYINFPLRIHANALPAAEAAMCAGAQDRFWPYHDRLFATVDKWARVDNTAPIFEGLAAELKLNAETFRQCVADHVMRPMIQADYQRGVQAGVNSTPTFLIGRTVIPGNAPIDAIRKAVKENLGGP